jgi:hypothetical protein
MEGFRRGLLHRAHGRRFIASAVPRADGGSVPYVRLCQSRPVPDRGWSVLPYLLGLMARAGPGFHGRGAQVSPDVSSHCNYIAHFGGSEHGDRNRQFAFTVDSLHVHPGRRCSRVASRRIAGSRTERDGCLRARLMQQSGKSLALTPKKKERKAGNRKRDSDQALALCNQDVKSQDVENDGAEDQ